MKHLQKIVGTKQDGIFGRESIKKLSEYLSIQFTLLGYEWPQNGLIWLRTDNRFTDTYDDYCVLVLNERVKGAYPASTTSGLFRVYNPFTVGGITGTAVTKPQWTKSTHRFETAQNWKTLWLKAPFFRQVRPIEIYRDGNRDLNIDTDIEQKGLFGIHFHRGGLSSLVDRWSAGCQVVPFNDWKTIVSHFSNGDVIDYYLLCI